SDTLGNVARAVGGLKLPNLERLGLGLCRSIPGLSPGVSPAAAYGVALPASHGKDSTTGHWEICGVLLERAFRTYPHGFPREPGGKTLLDSLAEGGIPRVGIGKVDDLFAGRNITSEHTPTNADAYRRIEAALDALAEGFIFVNVIEFDQSWGHRNDVPGF